jgi:uncharacterized repeat protein (TIGR02543 family)
MTVYAQWTELPPGSYTVAFKSNYGSNDTLYTKTVTPPATAIGAADFPANPDRNGYTFVSWNTAANGSESGFTATTTVSGNMTVYAQWTELPSGSYTVTFKLNDGTADVWETKTVTAPATTVTDFPDDPTRNGYTFASWNIQADGSGEGFTATTVVGGDITVYAQWTGDTYTVSFKSNDSTDTTLDTKTVTLPATTIAEADFPADLSRADYTFAGWNTVPDGSGDDFTATTVVSGDITVYARWAANTYTISFKSNYGTNDTLDTKTVTFPATTIAEADFPADPSRDGYAFAEWNTEPDGLGDDFTATTVVSADITVYAQWMHEYDISLNFDAGEGVFSQTSFTLSKGASESKTVSITGSGYANPRWFVDGDLKGTENSIAIDAADYGAGGHTLALIVSKGGGLWSKAITFTVAN